MKLATATCFPNYLNVGKNRNFCVFYTICALSNELTIHKQYRNSFNLASKEP